MRTLDDSSLQIGTVIGLPVDPAEVNEGIFSTLRESAWGMIHDYNGNELISTHLAGLKDRKLYEQIEGGRVSSLGIKVVPGFRDTINVSTGMQSIIAIEPIAVSLYQITHPSGLDPFENIEPSMKLTCGGDFFLKAGEMIRLPPSHAYIVRGNENVRYVLHYERRKQDPEYELVFSFPEGRFLATGISNQNHAKALTVLSIFENCAPDTASGLAKKFLKHSSPIVRWRAISTLNKARSADLIEILEAMAQQKPEFLAAAARRALDSRKKRR